ncbi:phenylalanine--tRNA ligase subunit beta [Microbacteriaceae bacterium]|nr:phenylalanine--tRNA ligase subunit beta [Candidatus Saccharibacteria bacterium]
MKVSLKTIEPYVSIPVGVEELVETINKQLGGVEEVINFTDKYKDVVIVNVVECTPHPNADKLSVCMVDDAGIVADVERDERGLVRVVCGAPNVHAGMLAAWLPPRSTVPSTYGTNDVFVLDARELRGIKSNGMLAASDELAIGSDHDGIVEIIVDEWNPYGKTPMAGARFADVYGLDDTVIDIENKMFTHRPDCFGQIGVAREIAGILGVEFKQPEWLDVLPEFVATDGMVLSVENLAKDVVPRLMAVGIKDITIRKSPLWMQCELTRLGSKGINNIVDVTNYMMLMTGQPTHAYDYDTLQGAKIVARKASEGETISLLNGKTYTLTPDDIVIADAEKAIGLAGIMGGFATEVTSETKNIVLEVATFDMYAVRKSSMRHGVFTDALTRFNKGQSPFQNPYIMSTLMKSVIDVAGGMQSTDVFDESADLQDVASINVATEFINARLGSALNAQDVYDLLRRVGFDVEMGNDANIITPPYWRTDISLPEDIVEEVGRLRGFDTLPKELPLRTMLPAPKNTRRVFKQAVRNSLAASGANELLTYSFVHEKFMKRAGQDSQQAFQLANALSPDLHYFRLSLLPSLIDKAVVNVRAGYDETLLFELGKIHNKKTHLNDDEGLPKELEIIEGVYVSRQAREGAAYYRVRRIIDRLVADLSAGIVYSPIDTMPDTPECAPFDAKRSAFIHTLTGDFVGIVGEFRQTVRANFKLPNYAAGFSLDIEALQEIYETATRVSRYKKLSKYPSVSQDISLKTSSDVSYADLCRVLGAQTPKEAITVTLTPGTIYQSNEDTSIKTTTIHIKCVSQDRTLTDDDVRPIVERMVDAAHNSVGAVQV